VNNIIILISIIVIAVILTIIAIIFVLKSKKKVVKETKTTSKSDDFIFFDDLIKVVNNQNSTKKDLLDVLKIFNENFQIDDVNAQKYLIFLSKTLTHTNVDKDIFQYFHSNIKSKNPKYKKELDTIELKALR
jgi:phosphate/sulfate permease